MISKKKKILFAAYGGGHIKVLIPVIQAFQNTEDFEPQVLAFTTAMNDCRSRDIPCKTLLDFIHLFPPKAMEIGNKLAGETSHHAIAFQESAAYLGISFFDLYQSVGYEEAYTAYTKNGRGIFCPIKAMEKILGELKPDIVITTNSPRSEMALLKAAYNLSIPSICVVDFYISKKATWLAEPWCGTQICVLDEFVKQQLIDIGRDPDTINITGNPAFDHYGSSAAREAAEIYRKANIGDASRLVAYASNIEPPNGDASYLPDEMMDFLTKECARLGYRLSHRQHPGEAMKQKPHNVLNGNETSLETFITSADLMITFPSTVIYEARLLGIPTLAIGMSKLMEQSEYITIGKYGVSYDFQEIRTTLENLKQHINQPIRLRAQATKHVIDTIHKIRCS